MENQDIQLMQNYLTNQLQNSEINLKTSYIAAIFGLLNLMGVMQAYKDKILLVTKFFVTNALSNLFKAGSHVGIIYHHRSEAHNNILQNLPVTEAEEPQYIRTTMRINEKITSNTKKTNLIDNRNRALDQEYELLIQTILHNYQLFITHQNNLQPDQLKEVYVQFCNFYLLLHSTQDKLKSNLVQARRVDDEALTILAQVINVRILHVDNIL